MELFPLKLQINLGQNLLSELQFERFVEWIVGNSAIYTEFACTPYTFSLLLDLFRWGVVGADCVFARGKFYLIALK